MQIRIRIRIIKLDPDPNEEIRIRIQAYKINVQKHDQAKKLKLIRTVCYIFIILLKYSYIRYKHKYFLKKSKNYRCFLNIYFFRKENPNFLSFLITGSRSVSVLWTSGSRIIIHRIHITDIYIFFLKFINLKKLLLLSPVCPALLGPASSPHVCNRSNVPVQFKKIVLRIRIMLVRMPNFNFQCKIFPV